MSTAVAAMMRTGGIPGLSVTVVNPHEVLFACGYGRADLRDDRPATASTAYPWFSMTKIVTATAALRLAEEGRLDLDAPVIEYLDYLRAPGTRQPTVRDLLSHSAGLANPLPIRWAHPADADPPDPEDLLRRVMDRRWAYRLPVGRAARYSNVGYLAVGQIIEVAAGVPFETYVERAVLRPLSMHRTGFDHPADTETATGYVKAPAVLDPLLRRLLPAGVAGSRQGSHLSLNPFRVDGPAFGGLIGNVLDAGRFLQMHLNDGELDGRRVITARSTRQMRDVNRPGKPFDHGLGWFRRPTQDPEPWVEHYGAGVGFWNVMRLYPDRGLGIVAMGNTTKAYRFEPLFALLARARWS